MVKELKCTKLVVKGQKYITLKGNIGRNSSKRVKVYKTCS